MGLWVDVFGECMLMSFGEVEHACVLPQTSWGGPWATPEELWGVPRVILGMVQGSPGNQGRRTKSLD
jgi:hypothetical protein